MHPRKPILQPTAFNLPPQEAEQATHWEDTEPASIPGDTTDMTVAESGEWHQLQEQEGVIYEGEGAHEKAAEEGCEQTPAAGYEQVTFEDYGAAAQGGEEPQAATEEYEQTACESHEPAAAAMEAADGTEQMGTAHEPAPAEDYEEPAAQSPELSKAEPEVYEPQAPVRHTEEIEAASSESAERIVHDTPAGVESWSPPPPPPAPPAPPPPKETIVPPPPVAQQPEAIVAPAKPKPSRQQDDEKAAQLGLTQREHAQINLRRSMQYGRMMVLTFIANLLVLAAAGYWYHQRFIAQAQGKPESSSHSSVNAAPTAPAATDNLRTETDAMLKRLAELEEQHRTQKAHVEELTKALADARKSVDSLSKIPPQPSPAVATDLPPTQAELVLLKERNRLTSYADECIATGARAPYKSLWQALDDPRLVTLVHAARAEILRVQNFYLGGSRLERFDIPVASYYPEDAALRDSQLKNSQLIKLMHEKKNPWEVRLKAANILGTRRSLEVGDALVETVKTDANLDVVKEATFSFEQMTGFRAKIFEVDPLEQWWKQFKATPSPPKLKPPTNPDPATPATAEPPKAEATATDAKRPAAEPVKKSESKKTTPAPAAAKKADTKKT